MFTFTFYTIYLINLILFSKDKCLTVYFFVKTRIFIWCLHDYENFFLTGLTIKNSLLDSMSSFILFYFFSQWFINNYFTSLEIVGKFYSLVVSNDGLIPIPNSRDSLQKD